MTNRGIAFLLAVLVLAQAAWAQPAADSNAVTRVVKFAATRNGSQAGKPCVLLSVTSKYGSMQTDIAIPNNDANARKPDPVASLMDVLKPLKKGDLLKVTYSGPEGRFLLVEAEKAAARPGEEDPEAYEFVRAAESNVAGRVQKTVLLRKADKPLTFHVFGKTEGGATVPDDAVLAQIGKLNSGDLADVEIAAGSPPALRGIYPYQAPKTATLVKVGSEKSGALTLAAVELKADAQTNTAYVRPYGPSNAADPAMLGKARAIQPNGAASYKVVEDGGKSWLLDIRPAAGGAGAAEMALGGTFTWTGKPRQVTALKGVLKPAGKDEWTAVWTFTWEGKAKTYTGTLKGDPKNGDVTGTGAGDGRKFTFTGKAQNGTSVLKAYENGGLCGNVTWQVQ